MQNKEACEFCLSHRQYTHSMCGARFDHLVKTCACNIQCICVLKFLAKCSTVDIFTVMSATFD